MIRVFSVKAHLENTRRLRSEYTIATDKKDLLIKVEEQGGYRIRAVYEVFLTFYRLNTNY